MLATFWCRGNRAFLRPIAWILFFSVSSEKKEFVINESKSWPSELRRLRLVLYVILSLDSRSFPLLSNMSVRASLSGTLPKLSSTHRILAPRSSLPLLPALPAICRYSVADSISLVCPLNFFCYVKITDLAGMLRPMANVEVAKTTLSKPSVKSISTISFRIGIMPAWWKPMPRSSRLQRLVIYGKSLSPSSSLYRAFFLKSLMSLRSLSETKFIFSSTSFASYSTWARLKKNTTQGSKCSFLM